MPNPVSSRPNHPNRLLAGESILLIVDIQSKLSVVMPTDEEQRMTANTLKLCTAAPLFNIPVLVTEQYPKGLGTTDPAILNQLADAGSVFTKTSFSCCQAGGFSDAVSQTGRQQIVLVGQETHVCVLQSALDLLQLGYQVFVVEDAVCSRQPHHKANALQRLLQQGVTLCNHESVLFEWLGDAQHPNFKTISALVR